MATTVFRAAATYHAFQPAQVEQFMAGLIEGLIQEDDLSKIQTCFTDATGVEHKMMEAIGDFMKKDLEDIIKGVKVVGEIVQEMPTDMADCKSMSSDIARIEAWAQIFKQPKALVELMVKNVIANFNPIVTDIESTAADIGSGDCMKAGQDIADIMVLTLGKVPEYHPEDLEITQW